MIWHPIQESRCRTARARKPGQDSLGKTATTGYGGQDRQNMTGKINDRPAWTEHWEEENQNKTNSLSLFSYGSPLLFPSFYPSLYPSPCSSSIPPSYLFIYCSLFPTVSYDQTNQVTSLELRHRYEHILWNRLQRDDENRWFCSTLF